MNIETGLDKTVCQFCSLEFNNTDEVWKHLKKCKKNKKKINNKEYYNKFFYTIGEDNCITCGTSTRFISILSGYSKYCNKHDSSIINANKNMRITFMKKYGVDNPMKIEEVQKKLRDYHHKKFYKILLDTNRLKGVTKPNFSIDDYKGSRKSYEWICENCGNTFTAIFEKGRIPRCQTCFKYTSNFENDIYEFCLQYYSNIIRNDRIVLNGRELDIYIPEINLAIECNGLYWHSEKSNNCDKTYHISKTVDCQKSGIKLIQIFEDEWIHKKDIVKSILLRKLNITSNDIPSDQCYVQEVNENIKDEFLNNNHIEGTEHGNLNIGLYLISIAVFKIVNKKNNVWLISRFCNRIDIQIKDSINKIFDYFYNKYLPSTTISYSDLRYGKGQSYLNIGFEFMGKIDPNYCYTKGDIRYKNQEFKKPKLKDKISFYDSSLTELENMLINGYDRIWDCGSNVFVYENLLKTK